MVSTQLGDTSTGTAITTADTVYIDWAFLNQGNTAITTPFQTELLLDGTQVHTWSADVPLDPSFYTYVTDFSLGQLSAGSHTVTVVADYLDQVTESNKNNNTVSYTFTVTQPRAGPRALHAFGLERATRGVHSIGRHYLGIGVYSERHGLH